VPEVVWSGGPAVASCDGQTEGQCRGDCASQPAADGAADPSRPTARMRSHVPRAPGLWTRIATARTACTGATASPSARPVLHALYGRAWAGSPSAWRACRAWTPPAGWSPPRTQVLRSPRGSGGRPTRRPGSRHPSARTTTPHPGGRPPAAHSASGARPGTEARGAPPRL
jgi:hypothetical protein